MNLFMLATKLSYNELGSLWLGSDVYPNKLGCLLHGVTKKCPFMFTRLGIRFCFYPFVLGSPSGGIPELIEANSDRQIDGYVTIYNRLIYMCLIINLSRDIFITTIETLYKLYKHG
ncbi:hypothetical protein Zmor_025594 [Zophobas morio]|uniref:Uncharacterized protein n=1 Tax=Zophobas morio TaxID=2755281 RepID=A0AA38HTQ8_9CUCU|nr:hypothetical protein Zmor_025594 [Zophobas morio]